jgi:hypothetical protein
VPADMPVCAVRAEHGDGPANAHHWFVAIGASNVEPVRLQAHMSLIDAASVKHRGVSWHGGSGRYVARITVYFGDVGKKTAKTVSLGYFRTKEGAAKAYDASAVINTQG